MADAVKVKGYREFLRACDRAGRETKTEVRNTFREVGEIVRVDAATRLFERRDVDPRTVAGLRTVVRQRGVNVEQRLRRTTGKRPDFGKFQMRESLVPALESKEDEVEDKFDEAMDRVADHFDRR